MLGSKIRRRHAEANKENFDDDKSDDKIKNIIREYNNEVWSIDLHMRKESMKTIEKKIFPKKNSRTEYIVEVVVSFCKGEILNL